MDNQVEVKPIFVNGNSPEIKIDPEMDSADTNGFVTHTPRIPSDDFEEHTNRLINSIPFNPELDVEVIGRDPLSLNDDPAPFGDDPASSETYDFHYCVYCQSHINNAAVYEAHVKQHMIDSRPLKCEMCEKRFVRKDKLMLHMRIHTGEKPFKCTECGRCFSRKDKLNNHIRTHTGEKPHQCILCQKSFARKDKMNLHMKSQHWLALSNLEITVVKYGDNGNPAQQPPPIEVLPKTE